MSKRIPNSAYYWLKITEDEFEHILFCGSIEELAEFEGKSINTIYSICYKAEKGLFKKPMYRRILKDEDAVQ